MFCHPLLLLPSNFPNIRVFSNESALHIRWPKYWTFSFNISPSNDNLDVPAARELLALYQAEAAKTPCVIVGGRLGAYKYFDMDRSIGNALETARSFLQENP